MDEGRKEEKKEGRKERKGRKGERKQIIRKLEL